MLIRGLILALLIMFGCATFQTLRANGLESKVQNLELVIDRCDRAQATLRSGLDEQNKRVALLGQQSQERLAETEAALVAARRENLQARTRLNAFLAQPTTGETVCERVEDIDQRFLTEIVR